MTIPYAFWSIILLLVRYGSEIATDLMRTLNGETAHLESEDAMTRGAARAQLCINVVLVVISVLCMTYGSPERLRKHSSMVAVIFMGLSTILLFIEEGEILMPFIKFSGYLSLVLLWMQFFSSMDEKEKDNVWLARLRLCRRLFVAFHVSLTILVMVIWGSLEATELGTGWEAAVAALDQLFMLEVLHFVSHHQPHDEGHHVRRAPIEDKTVKLAIGSSIVWFIVAAIARWHTTQYINAIERRETRLAHPEHHGCGLHLHDESNSDLVWTYRLEVYFMVALFAVAAWLILTAAVETAGSTDLSAEMALPNYVWLPAGAILAVDAVCALHSPRTIAGGLPFIADWLAIASLTMFLSLLAFADTEKTWRWRLSYFVIHGGYLLYVFVDALWIKEESTELRVFLSGTMDEVIIVELFRYACETIPTNDFTLDPVCNALKESVCWMWGNKRGAEHVSLVQAPEPAQESGR